MALALELKSEIVWPLLSQGEGSRLYEPPKGPLVVSNFFKSILLRYNVHII